MYQGEELGLPEVWDLPLDVLDDPTWARSGQTEKGRDGCRVPLPWTRSGPSLGFGAGSGWLPQPPHFAERSVEAQEEAPSSMLALYREAIAARRYFFGEDDSFHLLDYGPGVLAWQRGELVAMVNMGRRPVPLPSGEVVLSSATGSLSGELPVDTAVWVRS